ncbi:hypothetical protein C1Y35_07660 [Pseudomonas sp. GW456-L14]|uniref:phosphoribosyltransferase-like protein n=1 Tax=unclassified Pseudomonas TaxID=196821 RepID=UPI000C887544|nr:MULTISPECIES: hypothetical protein [unclassified Pseudomonas]PMY41454.1 hypothetical protein C1Y35_07660 [Pseudomonas sp. GW456-L14]PMY54763.1 hypothetical protein C1Y34_17070 [Pseudomonas sp. GW456-L12]
MRPLLIVSETRHVGKISEVLQKYGHPAAVDRFVRRLEIDLQTESDIHDFQFEIMKVLREKKPDGATNGYLICATHDAERYLMLRSFLKTQRVEFAFYSAHELCKSLSTEGQEKIQLAKLLGTCGLSVLTAASSILRPWTHASIDANTLGNWKGQFGRLGKYAWLADAILARTTLMTAPQLTDCLVDSPLKSADIAAFNRDGRGVSKSGDVIANQIGKRLQGLKILDSPADAIETMPKGRIVVVEDGLWSGTEVIGVFDSLLGRRKGREKTKPLANPDLLRSASLDLVYGVSTDYGMAMVKRYLQDEGLANISVQSRDTIALASKGLLSNIADPAFDIQALRSSGPVADAIKPHLFESLKACLTPEQCAEADRFLRDIGRQLWRNYLNEMKERKNWDMWSDEKLDNCALGMHGLGLTYAFGHSVPKATLPLLWGSGTVTWGGRTVDWTPLFQNA